MAAHIIAAAMEGNAVLVSPSQGCEKSLNPISRIKALSIPVAGSYIFIHSMDITDIDNMFGKKNTIRYRFFSLSLALVSKTANSMDITKMLPGTISANFKLLTALLINSSSVSKSLKFPNPTNTSVPLTNPLHL